MRQFKLLFLSILLTLPLTSLLATEVVRERTLPSSVEGVDSPTTTLSGEWMFKATPSSNWSSVQVPGEPVMQGFEITHDQPMQYKRSFFVESDYEGMVMTMRFDGVYSYSKLWVNGKFIREHRGGFTRWEADVTDALIFGDDNEIVMEVVDEKDDISYASAYAHHPIGGILRDVTLFASPRQNLSNLSVVTDLDEEYRDATLTIGFDAEGVSSGVVEFELVSPNGEAVKLQKPRRRLCDGGNTFVFEIESPLKWDAEHPNLYKLKVISSSKDSGSYSFIKQIGFREIEIDGAQMFVNGMPIKLRGACRHDIHPTKGRSTTADIDSLDVLLFKRANMNFVRTSHYPPTERFVEFCDRMGLYVECETAVCFCDNIHRHPDYIQHKTQNDPNYTANFMGQLSEMVQTFRSNCSVVIWSIGNESMYGDSFQRSYDFVKSTDSSRPVIFSYPGSGESKIYDIISMHYPGVKGDMRQFNIPVKGFESDRNMPVLFDEWAHVPSYLREELRQDPYLCAFWGGTMDNMWSNLFETKGGLGGAIWGFVDDTFYVPLPKGSVQPWWIEGMRMPTKVSRLIRGNCVGYGPWGIIDVWRREKPEYWVTKKSYSPIRVLKRSIDDFVAGEPLAIDVYNRFDHTNLDEVVVSSSYRGETRLEKFTSVEPHKKGLLVIPARSWQSGDQIRLRFTTQEGELIDAETITLGEMKRPTFEIEGSDVELDICESDDMLSIKGESFEIPIDKHTGLIHNAMSGGEVIIERGPFMNLDILYDRKDQVDKSRPLPHFRLFESDWTLESISHRRVADGVKVDMQGRYNSVEVKFSIVVTESGKLLFSYSTSGEHRGKLREGGIILYLPSDMNHLEWERRGYWSQYPDNHIAGLNGSIDIYNRKRFKYGVEPKQDWSLDTHDYFLYSNAGAFSKQPVTNNAKSMKEHCYIYRLTAKDGRVLTCYSPEGELGCRLSRDADEILKLRVNALWNYPEVEDRNYNYTKELEGKENSGEITIYIK